MNPISKEKAIRILKRFRSEWIENYNSMNEEEKSDLKFNIFLYRSFVDELWRN